MKWIKKIFALLLLASLLGCTTPSPTITINKTAPPLPTSNAQKDPPLTETITPVTDRITATTSEIENPTHPYSGYTHQQADGNRLVTGEGGLPDLEPFDIPLPDRPLWVVAVPWESGSLWVVVLNDGQILGFQVEAQGWQPIEITPASLAPGQPPLLVSETESFGLLIAPSSSASPLTHAIPLDQIGLSQAFIDSANALIIVDNNLQQFAVIDVHALPDARILSDESGRLLLLSNSTEKYDHGVLGDTIEAESITLIENPLSGVVSAIIKPPENLVIEGIAPIWADLNGDSVREIIVTVSNAQQGAQILVFSEEGQQVAAGPAIGQGYRWRHQIAVAPFGPNAELELAAVLTPHLGGVVEFYHWETDQLEIVAQLPGYTSHIIGTRNLDMASAGDFDGDGRLELLLPNQARTELGAIRRIAMDPGAEVAWSLPLDGGMVTNLGAATLPDGSIAIGIGQENGILLPVGYSLRIWHS